MQVRSHILFESFKSTCMLVFQVEENEMQTGCFELFPEMNRMQSWLFELDFRFWLEKELQIANECKQGFVLIFENETGIVLWFGKEFQGFDLKRNAAGWSLIFSLRRVWENFGYWSDFQILLEKEFLSFLFLKRKLERMKKRDANVYITKFMIL